MKFVIFCLLSLVLMKFCLGDKTSKFSILRNAIFEGYESDAKPNGKIDVQSGLMVTDFNLCPKKEVINKRFFLRTVNNLEFPFILLNKVLKTTGWAHFMWKDERLTWDPTDFGGIDKLSVNSNQVYHGLKPFLMERSAFYAPGISREI